MKDHDKKYVFSTGGDFDDKNLYPGIAIYHQGMDLVAVVSTGKFQKRIIISRQKNVRFAIWTEMWRLLNGLDAVKVKNFSPIFTINNLNKKLMLKRIGGKFELL